MASRDKTAEELKPKKVDAEGFTTIKEYQMNKPDAKSYEYTCVFSEGTEYKLTFEEENMKVKVISEDRKNTLIDFTSTSNVKSQTFKIEATGVYYLKMEKAGVDTKSVELAFKRDTK